MCCRRISGSSRSLRPATSRPASCTLPEVARRMQPIMDSSVVLPLPEGPISMTVSPCSTSKSTPCNTSILFLPSTYTLVTFRTEIAACIVLSLPSEDHRWVEASHLVDRYDSRGHAHQQRKKEDSDCHLPRQQDGRATTSAGMNNEDADEHGEAIARNCADSSLRDDDAIDVA